MPDLHNLTRQSAHPAPVPAGVTWPRRRRPAHQRAGHVGALLLLVLPLAAPAAPWPFVNELHYDNAGSDTGEGVEVAGRAGTDLSDWSLFFYNGSNGSVYGDLMLSGTIDDEGNGFGALFFPVAGLQNGPDGIALVDPAMQVVEFLAYEGSFQATDGPAAGLVSVLLPVAQASDTPAGLSLQRVGRGTEGEGFTWAGPVPASAGEINDGQELVAPIPLPASLPLLLGAFGALFSSRAVTRAARPVTRPGADAATI